jgi:hypothetical protein
LQRSLLMAPFLHQSVLGSNNVTAIYALAPMTHLQTAGRFPDMAPLVTIQQFALLNQYSMPGEGAGTALVTANSFPINASYAAGPLPSGVATPIVACPSCQGLDFKDVDNDNENLVSSIITANQPGFHVFSSPWETTSTLMANINKLEGYNLDIPAAYKGPNYIYAISITPSGSASLATYNSNVNPPSTYPALPPSPLVATACSAQPPFSVTVTPGIGGAQLPDKINTNETLYMIRHAEAHPSAGWENGNYVAPGQWRALDMAAALNGKISPDLVYSIDPAQVIPVAEFIPGISSSSYIRPSLTVEPYAIANNLPLHLVTDFEIFDMQNSPLQTETLFFSGGQFSDHKVLLAWEHDHFQPTINLLLSSYFRNGGAPTLPAWPSDDYDTVWTATIDANGNLTVDNAICQGINSASLPLAVPQF